MTLYTTGEAAGFVRTSPDRIRDLIDAGEISAIDIRGPGSRRACWRITEAELQRWLASRTRAPAATMEKSKKKRKYTPVYYT